MVLLLSSFSMSRFTFQLKQHKNFKIHQIRQSVPMGQSATVKNFKIQIRQSVPMGQATVKNFKIHQIRQSVPMGQNSKKFQNSSNSSERAHGSSHS